MSSADQSRVTATVAGRQLGEWDSRTGGETTADGSRYRPGGGREEVGNSKPTTGDVTIARKYERERDHELARWLRKQVGKALGSVNEQPTDNDDLPWGKPVTWSGKLMGVDTGEYDSQSGDPRMITLTFAMTEVS